MDGRRIKRHSRSMCFLATITHLRISQIFCMLTISQIFTITTLFRLFIGISRVTKPATSDALLRTNSTCGEVPRVTTPKRNTSGLCPRFDKVSKVSKH